MVSEKNQFIDGSRPVRTSKLWYRVRTWALAITASLWLLSLADSFHVYRIVRATPSVKEVSKCTIKGLQSDLSFLDKASAITKKEFLGRRDRLAVALAETGIDGFVLAPGYTSQYYANISQGSWEGEEPSERPFLMVILPETAADGTVTAKTGFLAPHFEEGRARMLPIPSKEKDLDIVVWEEEWSPYETLRKSRFFENHPADSRPKLMIEEEMRDFIVRGLDAASFDTVGLNTAAELVRQRKSPAEIEIMRAVNTGTLAAVRALRRCLEPGLTEDDVKQVYSDAVRSIGFEPTFTVVLFDENAALPHGGSATGSKKLTDNAMILTDVGAHYLGYSSDVTRSFMINKPSSKSEEDPLLAQKQEVWQVVYEAQTAAMLAMVSNATAAEVDIAARTVIEHAGYGYAFTHRLGHSIGIKGHESPYLSKWNKDTRLQQGMVFTDEPGIYLEQRFGVRLEDVFVVTEDGEPELLTGGRAKSMYEP